MKTDVKMKKRIILLDLKTKFKGGKKELNVYHYHNYKSKLCFQTTVKYVCVHVNK